MRALTASALLALLLAGCVGSTADDELAGPPPEGVLLGTFSSEDLLDAGAGGCGASLAAVDDDLRLTFFRGLGDSPAWLSLDGELTALPLVAASGEVFYDNAQRQEFADGTTTAVVQLRFGEQAAAEVVGLEGDVTVTRDGVTAELLDLPGSAGC